MATYRVVPITKGSSWKIHGWRVEKAWLFGSSLIRKFVDRQEAINFAKMLGDQHRPSHIKIYDNKGNVVSSWSYQERPKIKG